MLKFLSYKKAATNRGIKPMPIEDDKEYKAFMAMIYASHPEFIDEEEGDEQSDQQ